MRSMNIILIQSQNLNIKHSDICKASKLLNNLRLGNIVYMETIPVTEAEVISIK
jgi:hypothetical protein